MERLAGKKVLITGGSRGIGAGICRRLSQEGAQVAFTYSSSEDAARGVLESLAGNNHIHVKMNLSQTQSVEQAFQQVLEHFNGQIDGLVNNAGITKDQLLLRMKDEDFDSVIQTNLKGTYLCTKLALKPMLKARQGSIVNISSVIGHSGNPGQSNYAASKAGIEAFSRSIALEVGSRGIRINSLAPGFIVTDMTDALNDEQKEGILTKIPLQKLGTVEDIAASCSFLLSDESSYITGQVLHVNGGLFMA